jgi:hypothetical protein
VKRERCIGTLHGPVGDCLRPVVVGLFCFGYLDEDDEGLRPRRDGAPGELRPLLFPVCSVHRIALADWAETMWGPIADAFWVPPQGFDVVKRQCEMDADPLVMSPDPARAVAAVA